MTPTEPSTLHGYLERRNVFVMAVMLFDRAQDLLVGREQDVLSALFGASAPGSGLREREFFIDNLLVRIHFIIVMISADRPCAMGV